MVLGFCYGLLRFSAKESRAKVSGGFHVETVLISFLGDS